MSRHAVLGLLAAIAGCRDSSGPSNQPPSEYRILFQPARVDTISAEPAQPFVVEVRDADGVPVRGAEVEFATLPIAPGGPPAMLLRSLSAVVPLERFVDWTDLQGRTGAFLTFGGRAGEASLTVEVAGLPIDTIRFDLRSGAVAVVRFASADTTLYVGGQRQLILSVADRNGNPVTDPPSYVVEQPNVASIAGAGLVTGGPDYGVTRISATVGSVADTVEIVTVPRGTLAVHEGEGIDRVVLVDLDGSGYRPLASAAGQRGPVTFAWMPNGTELVVARVGPSGQELVRVGLNGTVVPIRFPPLSGVLNGLWPSVPRSGAWIYFAAETVNRTWSAWRIRPTGAVAESLVVSAPVTWASAISPDGSALAYQVDPSPGSEFTAFDLASGRAAGWQLFGGTPAWSPDGQTIAFVDQIVGAVRVTRSDGTGLRMVSSRLGAYSGPLAWSPDGQWLVARGRTKLELLNVQSGLSLPLTHSSNWWAPAWKP